MMGCFCFFFLHTYKHNRIYRSLCVRACTFGCIWKMYAVVAGWLALLLLSLEWCGCWGCCTNTFAVVLLLLSTAALRQAFGHAHCISICRFISYANRSHNGPRKTYSASNQTRCTQPKFKKSFGWHRTGCVMCMFWCSKGLEPASFTGAHTHNFSMEKGMKVNGVNGNSLL